MISLAALLLDSLFSSAHTQAVELFDPVMHLLPVTTLF